MRTRSQLDRETKTFTLDAVRGLGDGVVHSVAQSVALLIAVQLFATPDALTALIAAGPFIGNLLSLFYSAQFSSSRFEKSKLAAAPLFAAGVLFAGASEVESSGAFAALVTLAVVCSSLRLAFLAAIYHDNYAASHRGVLFSRGLLLSIVSGLVASYTFGKLLDADLSNYTSVLRAASLAAVLSGVAVYTMPSTPPQARGRKNPLSNLALVFKHKTLGYVLFVWFIFGFANLCMHPLRVIYLAEKQRGLGLSPWLVLLLVSVVLESARLLFTPFWAKLFDRLNFIVLRMILNALLAAGIVLFFATDHLLVIGLGSFLLGVGLAGGGIAWNLWITRFAPAGETHVYMSIHTFLTGVRGMLAPYVGFWLMNRLTMQTLSWLASGLIVLSVVLLWPAIRWGRLPMESAGESRALLD